MKTLFLLFAIFLFNISSEAQIKDSLEFRYFDYKTSEIFGNLSFMTEPPTCKAWQFDTDPDAIKEICGLSLWNREQWDFFNANKKLFRHVRGINILNINIDDFSFLGDLPNLEYVSMGILDKKNIKSFVENLNRNKNVYLLGLFQYKKKKFPEELNNLRYIKALQINVSRINYFKIDLTLKQLIISYNSRKIKHLRADNTNYISLIFNELKKIPEGLSESENLIGLEFSDYTDYKIECPIPGFEKLEIFSAFGAKGLKVSRDCFENKGINEVWGNIYEEYPLNEANEKND